MKTLRCGLVGDHIGQTRFPAALNLMCQTSGIGLAFELIDTPELDEPDFAGLVDRLQRDGWDGVSVTHPYKQVAAAYAHAALDPETAGLGAANMLLFGATVQAGNTDYTGFLSAWKTHMGETPVGCVAMAGAGGVARAIGPALARLGAEEIRICDSCTERATALAAVIGDCARVIPCDRWPEAINGADGLVNATPMGMGYRPGSAFPAVVNGAAQWAFDAVYTPTDTRFLTDCARAGMTILSGFDMFRHMAMCSFQAYTGIEPDPVLIMPKLAALRPEQGETDAADRNA